MGNPMFDATGQKHLFEAFTLCNTILSRYIRSDVKLNDAELTAFRAVQDNVDCLLSGSCTSTWRQNGTPAPPSCDVVATARDNMDDLLPLLQKWINISVPLADIIPTFNEYLSNLLCGPVHTYYANDNDGILYDPVNGVAARLDNTTSLGQCAHKHSPYAVADTMYIPLVLEDKLVGCVEAVGLSTAMLSTCHQHALRIMAVALRAYLETERLTWEAQKTEAMLNMATRLACDNLEENVLVQSIMNTTKALTESDRCSLFIVKGNVMEAHFEDGNVITIPADAGIAGYVAQTGDVVNIPNAYEDDRFNREVDKATGYRTKTVLCLPVQYEGAIVAVAQMINKVDLVTESGLQLPRVFGNRDVELFRTFSVFVAASLRNCHITENLANEKKKSDAILDVVALLSNTDIRDVDSIVRHVLHGAKKLLNADRSSLFLLDKERNELYSRMADSVSGKEIRFPSGQGIAGTVAASGIGENIVDAYKDSRFNSVVDKQFGYRTQSILCEPIVWKGEVLAVVQLVNKLDARGNVSVFSEKDLDTFKVFSLFAGISINNAHLLEFAIRAGQEAIELNMMRAGPSALDRRSSTREMPVVSSECNAVLAIDLQGEYDFASRDFDLFEIREKSPNALDAAAAMIHRLLLDTGLPQKFGCREETLLNFILQCRRKYRRVPYHNFFHVVDVCQTLHTYLFVGKACDLLTELECYVLLITALVHDLDHMGLNNSFYLKTDSPLGILSSASGNKSVLEVHHCNLAVEILSDPSADVFEGLNDVDVRFSYRALIDTVLATDMVRHGEMLKSFCEMCAKGFDRNLEADRRMVMETLMKAADVSNVTKPFPISREWAMAVTEEFYRQGDMEKEKGVDVAPMFDRSKNNELARGQIGFIDFLAGPFYNAIVPALFHGMQWCVDNITSNRAKWQKVLDARASTSE